MPMRIIGRGREAYVLAGYLQKRGKWTRRWEERYFVLTYTALHWFKKERGQLFGEERGHFLVDSMEVSEIPEKRCFSIKSIQAAQSGGKNDTSTTTVCKANSSEEYEIWVRALRDVVAGGGQAKAAGHTKTKSGGGAAVPAPPALPRQSSDTHLIDGGSSRRGSEMLQINRQNSNLGSEMEFSEPETPGAHSFLKRQGHVKMEQLHNRSLSNESNFTSPGLRSALHIQPAADGTPLPFRSADNIDEMDIDALKPKRLLHVSTADDIDESDDSTDISQLPVITKQLKESNSQSTTRLSHPPRQPSHHMTRPSRTYSRANPTSAFSADANDDSMLPPASLMGVIPEASHDSSSNATNASPDSQLPIPGVLPTLGGRPRSLSSVGSAIDPMLVVMLEKNVNSSVTDLLGKQMRPAMFRAGGNKPSKDAYTSGRGVIGSGSGRPEVIVARNVPWKTQIHIPGYEKGDTMYALLGDGSRVVVKYDVLTSSHGERLFPIDDPYRKAHALIRWQRVKPTFTFAEALNCATFVSLPVMFFALLVMFVIRDINASPTTTSTKTVLNDLMSDRGVLALIASTMAIYSMVDAVQRINGSRNARMWLFTFVELYGPPPTSMTAGLAADKQNARDGDSNEQLLQLNQSSELRSPHITGGRMLSGSRLRGQRLPPRSPQKTSVTYHNGHTAGVDTGSPFPPSAGSGSEPSTVTLQPPIPHRSRTASSGTASQPSGATELHSPSSRLKHSLLQKPPSPLHHSTSHPNVAASLHAPADSHTSTEDFDDTLDSPEGDGDIDLAATDVEYDSDYARSDTFSRSSRSRSKKVTAAGHVDTTTLSPATSGVIATPTPPLSPTHAQHMTLDEYASKLVQEERAYLQASLQQKGSSLPPYSSSVWGQWTEDDLSSILVRGPTFTADKKKVACGIPIYSLVNVDMMYSPVNGGEKLTRQAERRGNYAYKRYKQQGLGIDPKSPDGKLSPMLIINFVYPGPDSRMMTITCYYKRRVRTAAMMEYQQRKRNEQTSNDNKLDWSDSSHDSTVDIDRVRAFDNTWQKFLDGTDDDKDSRFKIIARVAEGSWVVKKGVGATPAILGRKIKQSYYYDTVRNIFELDVDVGSSVVAGRILSLVKSAALSLTIDMSFILQGENGEELPESVLCGVRVKGVDIMKIQRVEEVERQPIALVDP